MVAVSASWPARRPVVAAGGPRRRPALEAYRRRLDAWVSGPPGLALARYEGVVDGQASGHDPWADATRLGVTVRLVDAAELDLAAGGPRTDGRIRLGRLIVDADGSALMLVLATLSEQGRRRTGAHDRTGAHELAHFRHPAWTEEQAEAYAIAYLQR